MIENVASFEFITNLSYQKTILFYLCLKRI